jgi:hypothetical protein
MLVELEGARHRTTLQRGDCISWDEAARSIVINRGINRIFQKKDNLLNYDTKWEIGPLAPDQFVMIAELLADTVDCKIEPVAEVSFPTFRII